MIRALRLTCLPLLISCLPNLLAQEQRPLETYTNCALGDSFQIRQVDRLPGPMSRPVKTKDGEQSVALEDGYRVLITYDETEPFVNLKAEQLAKASYERTKLILIDVLAEMAKGTGDMESNTPVHLQMGSFDVYGVNRKVLQGGVLSAYTLFRHADHTAVTIYFLNDDPAVRKFKTVEQYRAIRDDFLKRYTSCFAGNPKPPRRSLSRAGYLTSTSSISKISGVLGGILPEPSRP